MENGQISVRKISLALSICTEIFSSNKHLSVHPNFFFGNLDKCPFERKNFVQTNICPNGRTVFFGRTDKFFSVWHLYFIYKSVSEELEGFFHLAKKISTVKIFTDENGIQFPSLFFGLSFFVKLLFLISKEMKLVSEEVEYSTRLTYPLWIF